MVHGKIRVCVNVYVCGNWSALQSMNESRVESTEHKMQKTSKINQSNE